MLHVQGDGAAVADERGSGVARGDRGEGLGGGDIGRGTEANEEEGEVVVAFGSAGLDLPELFAYVWVLGGSFAIVVGVMFFIHRGSALTALPCCTCLRSTG